MYVYDVCMFAYIPQVHMCVLYTMHVQCVRMYGTVHGKGNDNNVRRLTVFGESLIELVDMS